MCSRRASSSLWRDTYVIIPDSKYKPVGLRPAPIDNFDLGAQDILQLQVGEHLHSSPQAQPVVWPVVFALWQPHLQVAPAQDGQLHGLDWFDIGISFSVSVDVAPTTGVSHSNGPQGLYETAIFTGRIGYLARVARPGVGAASVSVQNGEGISANLPRINTDGAIPTI